MATVLSYFVVLQNSIGETYEAEINFDCKDKIEDDGSLDETARRHIISKVVEEGGRVIKIRKLEI